MHTLLENPKKRVPLKNVTTSQVIQMISDANLNPNIDKIKKLRSYDKSDKQYGNLKASLVCFTPNGSFSRWVDIQNISSASGLVYIDFDAKEGFRYDKEMTSLRNNPHVRAAWTSVSGRGIGCLMRAAWSDVSNFKLAFGQALTSLGQYGSSISHIDKGCSDITRVNFISYSDDVYSNENVVSLPLPNGKEGIVSLPILKGRCNAANDTSTELTTIGRIKYKTEIEDWQADETIRFIPEGKDYVRLYIGERICAVGDRSNRLFQIGCTIMTLNPELILDHLSTHLWAINVRLCEIPLAPSEINKIAASVHKIASSGGTFTYSKKKKVWFNPNCGYSPSKKQSLSAQIIAGERAKKTLNILEEGARRLIQKQMKVTQLLLSLETGMSLGTVKRYWNRLKNLHN